MPESYTNMKSKWTCPYCNTSISAVGSPTGRSAHSLVAFIRDSHEEICRRAAQPETMTDGSWSIEYGPLMEDGGLYGPTPDRATAEKHAAYFDELGMPPKPMGQQRVWRERGTEVVDA